MLNLDKNSFSAKFYRWFYSKEDMPTNLCPYFWALLAAYLLFTPWMVLTLPYFIMTRITKDKDPIFSGEALAVSIFLYLLLFVLVCMGFAVVNLFYPINSSMVLGGKIAWFFAFGVLIVGLFIRIQNRIAVKRPYDYKPTPNLIVEFVKAKYNKYCPQITWK